MFGTPSTGIGFLTKKRDASKVQHIPINAAVQTRLERIGRYLEHIEQSVSVRRGGDQVNRTAIIAYALRKWHEAVQRGEFVSEETMQTYALTYVSLAELTASKTTAVSTGPLVDRQIQDIITSLQAQKWENITAFFTRRKWGPMLILMLAVIRMDDLIRKEYPPEKYPQLYPEINQ